MHFDDALETELRRLLADPRTCALGEVGLDYHYDFSPRSDQVGAFRRQIALAHETGLPIILHLREAHEEAYRIMTEEGFPEGGVLLHCFNLDWDALEPWLEKGCYAAFGGSLTFKKSDDTREAARRMPLDRILTETDAPYMTPEPMRGMECSPDHVLFTAERLAGVRGCESASEKRDLLAAVYQNALDLLNREPTAWQREHGSAVQTAAGPSGPASAGYPTIRPAGQGSATQPTVEPVAQRSIARPPAGPAGQESAEQPATGPNGNGGLSR